MLTQQALFRQTAIPAAAESLDAASLRGKAIAANLANITTPGYERIEVGFDAALRRAVAYRSKEPARPGGTNNVDVDMEAAKLAENQILFNYGVRFIRDERGMIESAIRGKA